MGADLDGWMSGPSTEDAWDMKPSGLSRGEEEPLEVGQTRS